MYFSLPKSNERQKIIKKSSNSSLMSTDSTSTAAALATSHLMAEERISEIIHNLDDHWGSPPILTPETLAHILNNQWVNITSEDEEIIIAKKVPKTLAETKRSRQSSNNGSTIKTSNKVISNLVQELFKTIQRIDSSNKEDITNQLKNDPLLQKFVSSSKEQASLEQQDNNILEHLVEVLKYHNNNESKTTTPSLPDPSTTTNNNNDNTAATITTTTSNNKGNKDTLTKLIHLE